MPIDALAPRLQQINEQTLPKLQRPVLDLNDVIATLRERVGSREANSDLLDQNQEQLSDAIWKYVEIGQSENFRHLRRCCYAATLPCLEGKQSLADDSKLFAAVGQEVVGYARNPHKFARLYAGLLSAYLGSASPTNATHSQPAMLPWPNLREMLQAGFPLTAQIVSRPSWLETLDTNQEVLSAEPTDRLSALIAKADFEQFDKIAIGLGLTGVSWVIRDSVLGAAQRIASEDDGAFKLAIGGLLELAEKERFGFCADEILAILLNRYVECGERTVEPQLRDAAVIRWKNPWMASYQAAWGRVSTSAREMVSGWLKLDLIQEFFELLDEDGRNDRSRFSFWTRYHEKIDDVYFVLGRSALVNPSADYVKLRSKLDGRLLKLIDSDPGNNAFVMIIGAVKVVEFSKTGNAAYFYRAGDRTPVFNLQAERLSLNKLKAGSDRGLHHAGWQTQFDEKLRRLGYSAPTSLPATAPAPSRSRNPSVHDTSFTHASLIQLCTDNGLEIVDHRSQGGLLRVRSNPNAPHDVEVSLRNWGFVLAPNGYWRRPEL